MKVVDIDIDKLKAYENNPRKNDRAVNEVAESIKQFGFKVPIVIDKDNVIIAGHTRLKAANLLRLKKVPCVVADDLTAEQAKAFRLADNKTGELAGWDFDLLIEELQGIDEIDMTVYGFTPIDDLDIDSFYEEALSDETENTKKVKKVICPKCGHEFEI